MPNSYLDTPSNATDYWAEAATALSSTFAPIAETVVAHGATGATETFDVALGTVHTATLDANCTFTFTAPTDATRAWTLTLVLTQDATGSRTITWPASVKWPAGVAPTLTTTASKTDILTFITYNQGVAWRGFVSGQNYT